MPRRPWLVEAIEDIQGQDAPGCVREGRNIGFHAFLLSLPQQDRLADALLKTSSTFDRLSDRRLQEKHSGGLVARGSVAAGAFKFARTLLT